LVACTKCQAIREAGKECPQCGFLPKRQGEHQHFHDGDLAELGRNGHRERNVVTAEHKREVHGMLVHIALDRGYKTGWAAHQHKEKFGHWPEDRSVPPITPSPEIQSWVRSRMIAYAKSRQKARF
jgi:DNA repair protein RadD